VYRAPHPHGHSGTPTLTPTAYGVSQGFPSALHGFHWAYTQASSDVSHIYQCVMRCSSVPCGVPGNVTLISSLCHAIFQCFPRCSRVRMRFLRCVVQFSWYCIRCSQGRHGDIQTHGYTDARTVSMFCTVISVFLNVDFIRALQEGKARCHNPSL
jgi:hypothetical protein